LRNDHRWRREQQTEFAERAGARQQQIDEQAHHHRRQAHQRVQHHDHRLTARKAPDRDGGAERQPEQRSADHGRQADRQAQADDLPQAQVERRHQPQAPQDRLKHRAYAFVCISIS